MVVICTIRSFSVVSRAEIEATLDEMRGDG